MSEKWKAAIQFGLYIMVLPAALFISAGRLDWVMGWVFIGITILLTIASRLIVAFRHPDLLAERARYSQAEGVKRWDKVLVKLVGLYGLLALLIVPGLDKRFGWTPELPLSLQIGAAVVVVLGYLFGTWAMAVNRFFSAVVRIQKDRGHSVVTAGPYRFVRHPSYAGALANSLAAPLMLSSLWALIPAGLMIVAVIFRTALEDQTLRKELPGYEGYASKTRFRLVPGIW